MDNYKNRLQEHFQKHGLALPHYHHSEIVGEGWMTELILTQHGKVFRGLAKSKIEADQIAAKLALDSLGIKTQRDEILMDLIERVEALEKRVL